MEPEKNILPPPPPYIKKNLEKYRKKDNLDIAFDNVSTLIKNSLKKDGIIVNNVPYY